MLLSSGLCASLLLPPLPPASLKGREGRKGRQEGGCGGRRRGLARWVNRKKGRVEEEGEGRMVHSLKASKMGERGGGRFYRKAG